MINKFNNIYSYLSLAQLLSRGDNCCGSARKKPTCLSGRPPYHFTYNRCQSRDSNSGCSGVNLSECSVHYATWTPIQLDWCCCSFLILSNIYEWCVTRSEAMTQYFFFFLGNRDTIFDDTDFSHFKHEVKYTMINRWT